MAIRPVFVANPKSSTFVDVIDIEFNWFPGFSIKQKQRSINSLHENFKKMYLNESVLEVSSKSEKEVGMLLSAFNLMINTKNNKSFSVETAFQSSKVFEMGGPYMDLYNVSSKEAKKDPRLKSSGKLLYFQYFNRKWPLEPKTLFYDWLYINALSLNKELSERIIQFTAFTDIEFNPEKSINCQAKSAALYVSLHNTGKLKYVLESVENYIELLGNGKYKSQLNDEGETSNPTEQTSLFD